MAEGWVKLHRTLTDSPIWKLEKFTRGQAWVDIFLNANHTDGYMNIRGNIIPIKRTQLGWSELTMSKRWRWSRGKVRRFLSWLENEGKIVQQKNRLTTILTICNYERYQGNDTTDSTADSTADGQQTDSRRYSRRYTNNNDKTVKNEKNERIPYRAIIEYLNEKSGRTFAHTTQSFRQKIKTRWREHPSIEDFKKVIDNKCADPFFTENPKYLNPDTLFSTKFDKYLADTPEITTQKPEGRGTYDHDAYEKLREKYKGVV